VRTIRALRVQGRRDRRLRRGRGDRRGVSDVVGTILLLALTVTLFSSIFLFVDTFPQPPAQPSSQFSAQLLYGGAHGQSILGLTIEHLAGPTLAGQIFIYLSSADHPSRFTSPFTLANGLNGSTTWNLGQTYYLNLTSDALTAPDNITISIISTTELLFRVTLPGQNPILPPQFVAQGTNPALPTVGQSFTVFVQIDDPALKGNWVEANISQVPGTGEAALQRMSYSTTTGLFSTTISHGANAAGTYYIFVNASDNNSLSNSIALAVTILSGNSASSSVGLSVSPTPPVNGSAATVYATVTNGGASSGTVNLTFRVGGVLLGTATGPITAGGTSTFSKAWTPSAVGSVILTAQANISGGGSPEGALNMTVFPSILFIAHSTAAGTHPANNSSAYLAEEIQAAGFPFTTAFVPCGTALSSTDSYYESDDIVIIDFGSASSGSCAATPSTTVQGTWATAMASPYYTAFLIVGSAYFTAGTCSSFSSTFTTDVGITGGGGSGTCFTSSTSTTSTVTYTASTANGLRQDGIGALTLNKTLNGLSSIIPYYYDAKGATGGFLATTTGTFGSFGHVASLARGVAIDADPSQLMTTLPAPTSSAWGIGAGGTAVLYNVLDYLGHLSSSSSTGHGLSDYSVAGATLVGTSASHLTYLYVTVRSNGPSTGLVSVKLTVNGEVGLYQGSTVSAILSTVSNGRNVTAVLTWEAPATGSYTLSVVATGLSGNLWGSLVEWPLSITNSPITFTT
jgi:flagellin-like protein